MTWQQTKRCIDALPDNLELKIDSDDDTLKVVTKTEGQDQESFQSVKIFQNIWASLKTTADEVQLPTYLKELRESCLTHQEVHDLSAQIPRLADILSIELNDMQLRVTIDSSLTKLLSEIFDVNDPGPVDDNSTRENLQFKTTKHRLTVVIQSNCASPTFYGEKNAGVIVSKFQKLVLANLPELQYQKDHSSFQKFSAKVEEIALSETLFDEEITESQVLIALAIVLKTYPEKWREAFFWNAWLAVALQLCSLPAVNNNEIIFPCIWIKQIFEAERYLQNPENVKLLLFGLDPPSASGKTKESTVRDQTKFRHLCEATGIAFHGISGNASINGMKTRYELNCDGNDPITFCKNGLLMVNLIQCIVEFEGASFKNSCYRAWIAYTLKIMHYFSSSPRNKPVIVLSTSTNALTKIYIPKVCKDGIYVAAPHPSASIPDIDRYKSEKSIVKHHLNRFKEGIRV